MRGASGRITDGGVPRRRVLRCGGGAICSGRCWGHRARATVVDNVGPSDSPRFHFTDAEGRQHEVSGAVMSLNRAFAAGQRVPLLYLPGRPQTFVIDWFGDKWGAPLFFLLVG